MTTKSTTPAELTLMSVMARFSTEESARGYFESVRWPHGVTCPHCGNADSSSHLPSHGESLGQDPARHVQMRGLP